MDGEAGENQLERIQATFLPSVAFICTKLKAQCAPEAVLRALIGPAPTFTLLTDTPEALVTMVKGLGCDPRDHQTSTGTTDTAHIEGWCDDNIHDLDHCGVSTVMMRDEGDSSNPVKQNGEADDERVGDGALEGGYTIVSAGMTTAPAASVIPSLYTPATAAVPPPPPPLSPSALPVGPQTGTPHGAQSHRYHLQPGEDILGRLSTLPATMDRNHRFRVEVLSEGRTRATVVAWMREAPCEYTVRSEPIPCAISDLELLSVFRCLHDATTEHIEQLAEAQLQHTLVARYRLEGMETELQIAARRARHEAEEAMRKTKHEAEEARIQAQHEAAVARSRELMRLERTKTDWAERSEERNALAELRTRKRVAELKRKYETEEREGVQASIGEKRKQLSLERLARTTVKGWTREGLSHGEQCRMFTASFPTCQLSDFIVTPAEPPTTTTTTATTPTTAVTNSVDPCVDDDSVAATGGETATTTPNFPGIDERIDAFIADCTLEAGTTNSIVLARTLAALDGRPVWPLVTWLHQFLTETPYLIKRVRENRRSNFLRVPVPIISPSSSATPASSSSSSAARRLPMTKVITWTIPTDIEAILVRVFRGEGITDPRHVIPVEVEEEEDASSESVANRAIAEGTRTEMNLLRPYLSRVTVTQLLNAMGLYSVLHTQQVKGCVKWERLTYKFGGILREAFAAHHQREPPRDGIYTAEMLPWMLDVACRYFGPVLQLRGYLVGVPRITTTATATTTTAEPIIV
jgi:hypothetical protein